MNTWFSNLEIIQIGGLLYICNIVNLAYDEYMIFKSWNYRNWWFIVYVILYMSYCNLAYDEYMFLKSWNYTNWWFIVYVILQLSIWWIHDYHIWNLYKLGGLLYM